MAKKTKKTKTVETPVVEVPAKKLIKLDIACGQNKQKDFIGVDIAKIEGVDVVHDLEIYPWPFEDESVEEAFCSHYIEHVGDLIKFMNELYRILTPGAKCIFLAPYYTSVRCWQDPTHKNAISEHTFLYYNEGWRKVNKLDHYNINCDFDFSYGYIVDPSFASRAKEAQEFAIKHYWNVVSDIQVTVIKRPKQNGTT
jgi:SAM-dependent methyltransferase